MKIATPDLVTNSYFPALAAEELGLYREEGLDAHVELLPSLDAVKALRDGTVDFVAGGAHSMLLAFPGWTGANLVVTLSQGTPWLLVLRADLSVRRGDIGAVKGLRIGAAPGPDHAFLHLLHEVGIDPVRDGIAIAPVPGGVAPGASFGVVAAEALERGLVDGFWAQRARQRDRRAAWRREGRRRRSAWRRPTRSGAIHVRRPLDDRRADRPRT